ncbi:MAG: transcriptional regulator [Candidatus Methanoplasma sp.]|jgi:predicted transcriptional regulator|nr:transcriptional regulator [Candidatus Methanoplasma sp.]
MTVDDLVASMLREEGGFQKAFKNILNEELDISLSEFCSVSGVSQSTMYKILEENREPNLRTIRQIVKSLKTLYRAGTESFVAIVASPSFMEALPRTIEVSGTDVKIREYPISTIEDAIIAAVRAERDNALAVVCAPIVAPVVEKILSIPVVPIMPLGSVIKALDMVKGII